MKEFQWKILHRIIYTEHKLQMMNRSNGKCHLFNGNSETLSHLFFNCDFTEQLMQITKQNIVDKIPGLANADIFNEENMIFGEQDEGNMQMLINTIIITLKWTVWKERNIIKYQHKAQTIHSAFIIQKNILKTNILMYSHGTPTDKLKVLYDLL